MVVQMAHSGGRITSEGEIDHEGRLDWRIESSRNFRGRTLAALLMGLIADWIEQIYYTAAVLQRLKRRTMEIIQLDSRHWARYFVSFFLSKTA